MTAHTPGPWKSTEHDGRILVDGVRGFVCTLDQPPGPEQEANARIITAAPKMLALLKEIDETWPVATSELRERARKVIAEADGQPTRSEK